MQDTTAMADGSRESLKRMAATRRRTAANSSQKANELAGEAPVTFDQGGGEENTTVGDDEVAAASRKCAKRKAGHHQGLSSMGARLVGLTHARAVASLVRPGHVEISR